MKSMVLLLGLSLLFAGCSNEAESLDTVQQVVEALEEEDIECEDLETTTEFAENDEYESLVKERGLCTVDGEQVVVTMFANAEDREDWVAVASKVVGEVAIGPNWVLSTRSEEVADDVVEALDASTPEDIEES